MYKTIDQIIRERDQARQARAAPLARAALAALRASGIEAWLVGSLARGEFLQHSDIDLLIDCTRERRNEAIKLALDALQDFPCSIIFKADVEDHWMAHLLQEATDEPRLRV